MTDTTEQRCAEPYQGGPCGGSQTESMHTVETHDGYHPFQPEQPPAAGEECPYCHKEADDCTCVLPARATTDLARLREALRNTRKYILTSGNEDALSEINRALEGRDAPALATEAEA